MPTLRAGSRQALSARCSITLLGKLQARGGGVGGRQPNEAPCVVTSGAMNWRATLGRGAGRSSMATTLKHLSAHSAEAHAATMPAQQAWSPVSALSFPYAVVLACEGQSSTVVALKVSGAFAGRAAAIGDRTSPTEISSARMERAKVMVAVLSGTRRR